MFADQHVSEQNVEVRGVPSMGREVAQVITGQVHTIVAAVPGVDGPFETFVTAAGVREHGIEVV